MAGCVRPLMMALWSHIKPAPYPFGTRVAEVLGKMGGRSRRWLVEGMQASSPPGLPSPARLFSLFWFTVKSKMRKRPARGAGSSILALPCVTGPAGLLC